MVGLNSYDSADMHIEIQRGTEALNERHGAALRFPDGAKFRCATDQLRDVPFPITHMKVTA
jgi:hypothetical protein